MIKTLLITAGVAAVAAAVCLTGAAALVGHDIRTNGWDLNLVKIGDHVRIVKGQATAPEQTANALLNWSGGDRLDIDLPGEVTYTQGATASVHVSGPQALVSRVRIDGGRLYLAPGDEPAESIHLSIDHGRLDATGPDTQLHVTIVAPAVTSFTVSGSGGLSVHDYSQPALDIALNGSGAIDVDGKTQA